MRGVWFLVGVLLAAGAVASDPNPATIECSKGAWPLYRQWNEAEVSHFAYWIERIYAMKSHGARPQRAAKLRGVLTDPETNLLLDPAFAGEPANPPISDATIQAMHGVLDCGKLTIALTSYYAYRRGLPWMITRVRSGDGTDLRTAPYNVPCWTLSTLDYASPHTFLVDAVQSFCTGNYRVEPDRERAEWSDTVPVAIDRRYLKPGCLFYLDGHVLIVAHIDPYGGVAFLESTTASTRDIRAECGLNAVTGITPSNGDGSDYAGCYRGFRTFRFPIAELNDEGEVVAVRRRTDEEMLAFGYSTEQYDKIAELVADQQIVESGVVVDTFHDFVRLRLRTARQIAPVALLEAYADRMLEMMEAREALVQRAWADVCANGPITFPEGLHGRNVFEAYGRWGELATAWSDADLRGLYFDLVDHLQHAVVWFERMPAYVYLGPMNRHAIWTGGDLAKALKREKRRVFAARRFHYTTSAGERVPLSLLDLERRLYDLSFDPNHPPELRWGAPPGGRECQEMPEAPTLLPDRSSVAMGEAYRREAYYRTCTHREYDASFLEEMFTEDFPVRKKLDAHLGRAWRPQSSPAIVPHQGRAAWQRALAIPSG